jgi:hypothetical protein
MNKRSIVIVAAVLVLVAGALFASNMGFKLNYALIAAGGTIPEGGTSQTGTNTIALPYNPQTGITTASALYNDIGSAAVQNIQRFNRDTDTFSLYAGTTGDFNLDPGEGYRIRMAVGGTTNYIIVGSHDPSLSIDLPAPGDALPEGGTSLTGTTYFGYPYHSTAATADDLATDIGSSNVQNIQQYNRATDTITLHSPGSGPGFTLVPGAAYQIRMKVGSGIPAYTPSHY